MGPLFDRWAGPAALAACLLLTGGCAGRPPAPRNPGGAARPGWPPPPPPPAANDKRFIIAPELAGVLHVVNVRLTHPEDTYLKIQVTVQNMTAARQQFSYQIAWFDQNGAMLPLDRDEFLPWMLLPNEVAALSATAPMPAAADFGVAFVPFVK